MGVAENAIGAILTIPPELFTDITKAQRYIENLQITSKRASDEVAKHWGQVAVGGLDSFIQKISEAQQKMKGFGPVNININSGAAETQLTRLTENIGRAATSVSDLVQKIAITKVDVSGLNAVGMSIDDIKAKILDLQKRRDPNKDIAAADALTLEIRQWEELLRIRKMANEEKIRAAADVQSKTDNQILTEQNRLLNERAQLQKKISDEQAKISNAQLTTGKGATQDQVDLLKGWGREVDILNGKLTSLNSRYAELSVSGQKAFDERNLKGYNDWMAQTNSYFDRIRESQEKFQKAQEEAAAKELARNSEIGRKRNEQYHKEVEAEKMLDAARRKAFDKYDKQYDQSYLDKQKEAYARILDLRKQINAQTVTVEKGVITNSYTLDKDTKALADLRHSLAETLVEWRRYNNEGKDNLTDNGKNKARVAELTLENQLLKEQRKHQEELNKARAKAEEWTSQTQALKARLGNTEEATVQRQINTDYKEMIRILKEIGEVRAKYTAEGRAADNTELNLLKTLGQRYKQFKDDIQRVADSYTNMSAAAAAAFREDKTAQLARNAVLLAEAQRKADERESAAGEKITAQNKINTLYEKRLKLLKEQEQMNNKILLRGAAGGSDTPTSKEKQVLDDITKKLQQNEAEINKIANAYRALGITAQKAFDIAEIRQSISLTDKFNTALKRIDDSKVKKLTAEYKTLYEENLRMQKAVDDYNKKVAGKTTILNAAGAYTSAVELSQRIADNLTRMNEIERKNIREVTDYRVQMEAEANQKTISDYIQAEAQKTAEAKKEYKKRMEEGSNFRNMDFQRYANSYAGAMSIYNKLTTGNKTSGSYADTFENRERVIKNLEAAIKSLSKADADYKVKLKALSDAMNELKAKQKEMQNSTKPMVTAQEALDTAKNARSLKELTDARKKLKEVMGSTDPNKDKKKWEELSKAYAKTGEEIDKIRKKMGELRSESGRASNSFNSLKNYISTAFSYAAISGFIKKLVDVRAQFELQNVALRAILQNKDEADKIFQQVQNMALQSPFTIMQLTTYTKQLAAYRVESAKLLDTTKRLADVSAGLGVDMGRLILAYGQVKAANYLRATEVRQFTEAGLNIAGELATYFSELQGKMVSVGDVMDMITRRMVRFEDVEEVFKRVTSAGGLFYDMQKKQSESLYGQMQRISDAYSIMMNDIGKSNQGTIADVLKTIRALIQHWREVLPYIAAFAGAMAMRGVVGVLAMVIKNFATVVSVLKTIVTLQLKWNMLANKNVWGAILGIITAVVAAIWAADSATTALADELNRIRVESADDLKNSIADFHQLAKAATDAAKSYTERKEALDSLNRSYKDILPSYMLEAEWLESNIGRYDAAISKIEEYYRAKEMQKQVETILNSEDYTEAVKEMQELGEEMLRHGLFDATVTKKYTDIWMQQIAQEIASGKLMNTAEAVGRRLSEIFGKDVSVDDGAWESISKHFKNIEYEINHITLGSLAAKDNIELMNKELNQLSTEQIMARIEEGYRKMMELRKQIAAEEEMRKQIAAQEQDLSLVVAVDSDKIASENRLKEAKEAYQQLAQQVDAYGEALANAKAKEINDTINENIDALKKEISEVSRLVIKRNELARTNTGTEEENAKLANLNGELAIAKERTVKLADSIGVKLTPEMLESADNVFSLRSILEEVAKIAYPLFAKKAVEEVGKGETAIDRLVTKVGILKKAINSFSVGLGFDKVFEDAVADEDTKIEELNKQREAEWKKEQKRNKDYIKEAAERVSMDEKRISSIEALVKAEGQSDKDYAKNLRAKAKSWEDEKKAVDSITEAERNFYFEKNNLTQEAIDENAKLAEALYDIANAYDPIEKKEKKNKEGGRGQDPWIQIFKERSKALEDFYKQYETLRDKFSEPESQRRDMASFADYFKASGLDMRKVIAKGWDTKALVENLEETRAQIKKHFGKIYDDAAAIMRKGISIDAVVNPTAEQRLSHALAKLLNDLEKQIADNKIKLDFELQEKGKEELKSSLDELMATYELTKKFTDMGVSADMTNMFGKAPIEGLAELRGKVEKFHSFAVSLGKDGEKVYGDILKKIRDKEDKNNEERARNYVKYLTESLGERAQIEVKAMRDISKIRYDEQLDSFSKEQAINERRKKMHEDLNKVDLDSLKSSDVYISVFKDIETASREQLQYVINKLKELQSTYEDLSPAQVKSIANDMKKLEDAMADRDAFRSIRSDMAAIIKFQRNRNELLKEQAALQTQMDDRQQQLAQTEVKYAEAMERLKGISDKQSKEYFEQLVIVQRLEMTIKLLKDRIKKLSGDIADINNEIEDGESATERLKKTWEKIVKILDSANSLIGDLSEGLDQMGLMTDGLADAFESSQSVISSAIQTGTGAMQAFTDPNPINKAMGAMQALGGAVKLVGSLFAIGDKKKERQIKKLQEKVEDLGKAYEKLHDKMEKAYRFDDYNASYDAQVKNLQGQKQAYAEMIRLEEAKKKTDKEKIKEYKEALENIKEQERELREQRYTDFGSSTDYRSEAEDFVETWLSAYKETGDGLDALTDHLDEFFESLVMKQAASSVISTRMKKYIDQINAAIDSGDTGLSLSQTFSQIGENLKGELGQWNEDLKAFFDALGIGGGGGSLVLSDLQEGIRNITESQAAAIESYLNSIRFEVSRQGEQLERLIAAVTAQYGAGENPALTELRGIRSVLDSIHLKLSSLIETRAGGDRLRII